MVFSKFFLKVDKYKILNYYVYIYIYFFFSGQGGPRTTQAIRWRSTWLNKDILPPIFTRFRVVVVQKVIFKIKKSLYLFLLETSIGYLWRKYFRSPVYICRNIYCDFNIKSFLLIGLILR